jgi:hypothetical protein
MCDFRTKCGMAKFQCNFHGLATDGRLICRGWNGGYSIGFGMGMPGYCGAVIHAVPLRSKNCGYVDRRRMRAENKRLTHAAACGSGALPKRPRHAGMIRIPNLTFMALFDHVQTHLQRWARGRANLAPRAYAADVAGVVTVLAFPLPHDDAGREALGAVLELEMETREAVMVVLALPSRATPMTRGELAEGTQEVLLLDGRALSGAPGGAGHATRVLAVERRPDGRIARLVAASDPAIAKAGPVTAAKM